MTQHLNTEQIEALFAFVQKKRVRHYDLQVELVDHLASSIEGLWKENPDVSFEKALQKVYKRFGVTGFSRVILEKKKALTKLAWRWAFAYLKSWLRIPQLLFLVLTIISFSKLLLWLPASETVGLTIFIVLMLLLSIWFFINKRRNENTIKKRFLILEGAAGSGALFGGVIGCSVQIPDTIFKLSEQNVIWIYVFSAYFVIFFLILYALLIHNRKKALEYLHEHFPQFMV